MRALAELARSRGHSVTGSDRATGGHNARAVDGCELVVYTNAVPENNCELVRARQLGIPTVERAAYLGEVSRLYDKVIAVSGCHGKSTAAAMLGSSLKDCDPTVHVGVDGGSHIGGSRYFVTEACEYRRSFLKLSPTVGIILNIGFDHPDCYKNIDELYDAYRAFGENCKTLLVNGDDQAARKIKGGITFGQDENNVYRADGIKTENGKRSFTVLYKGKSLTRLSLSAVGAHNVYNALAAISAAHTIGYNIALATHGINDFTGIPRRFERKGIAYGKTVITDYAHHPDEIRATIAVAREIFPSISVVFQPHTYSRTKALAEDFAAALSGADSITLTPVFPARETDDLGVSSKTIADFIPPEKKCTCCGSLDEAVKLSKELTEKAVIFMGAGDINLAAEKLVAND